MTDEVTIAGLKPDAENPRRHNPRNVGLIVDALHEVGAARSVVIDEDGNVLAGNATVEAAMEAGILKVRVVDADGEELVAVRRTGLTGEQKKRLAYYDNRATDLSDWDAARIAADLEAGLDFGGLFLDGELERIMAAVAGPAEWPERDETMPATDAEMAFWATCPECGHRFAPYGRGPADGDGQETAAED